GRGENTPRPMPRNLAAGNVPEGFSKREQEIRGENRRRRGLQGPANGRHDKTHQESGNSNGQRRAQKHPPAHSVPHRVARAQARTELKRPQGHKKQSRQNVDQRQQGVPRKNIIERRKLRERRGGLKRGSTVAMHHDRPKRQNPPHDNRGPDQAKKGHGGPQSSPPWFPRTHTNQYALPG